VPNSFVGLLVKARCAIRPSRHAEGVTVHNLPFDNWRFVAILILVLALARVGVQRLTGVRETLQTQVLELLDSLLIAIVLVFCIIRPFVVQAFYIPSGSMRNTLQEKDRILVNRFIYRLRDPKPRDIVVFRAPPAASSEQKDFIKRLVAREGDLVAVREGVLYINGKPQQEPYTRQAMYYEFPPSPYTVPLDQEKWGTVEVVNGMRCVRVPRGMLFVLGDNRNDSNDGHRWGYLPRRNLLGRAMVIFWPVQRIRLLR